MMKRHIPFNRPHLAGKETEYIRQAVESGKISGDGTFTRKCHEFFRQTYGFRNVLLTTSCTSALEMCALLIPIEAGDEVIMPSFTFSSTANAFVLRGAKVVFVDSGVKSPNVDPEKIEERITSKTKAIVVVHYAGIACDMDRICSIAARHRLTLVEDAAQCIDSYYKKEPLGSIGQFGALSFHESKNIISGEGGLLILNDDRFAHRAEIIWEKGTNRAAFFRGEVDKYNWVDIGSSYLPSDVIAAFLFAQLETLREIQERRKKLWNLYFEGLLSLQQNGYIRLPEIPAYATNNAHMFFLLCSDLATRTKLISHLNNEQINAVFHYLPLHKSLYYASKYDEENLPNCEKYADCLLRLPLYYELTPLDVQRIIDAIQDFYSRS